MKEWEVCKLSKLMSDKEKKSSVDVFDDEVIAIV